jgi:hypothetical protein
MITTGIWINYLQERLFRGPRDGDRPESYDEVLADDERQ